jgi:membrane peptidoglycan carboxypeptidase
MTTATSIELPRRGLLHRWTGPALAVGPGSWFERVLAARGWTDRRDTWFVGYNADLATAVWLGFDQERSLGENEEGGKTALPMWIYFMQEALRDRPEHRQLKQ